MSVKEGYSRTAVVAWVLLACAVCVGTFCLGLGILVATWR